ncbi:MAG: sugar nucleotide-binding protein [Desulfobacula sp.]|jgi:dTDP-4-dehydrorhamnose reductase|nr:sugar nucleotide-binding protein [Desulfobacula sp.]
MANQNFKGKQAVHTILNKKALIIRTAWLYSSHGQNFVKTMLTLMKQKKELTVIDEQVGTPTWAFGLARSIWTALEKKITGTFHWTDASIASWYDFAIAIQEEAKTLGLLNNSIPIYPVPASAFPTPAKRPMYSVLDKTSFWHALETKPIHWHTQLRSMLMELN